GCDVFFIQTSCQPVSDYLLELLIALDALKYASAGRITAVLPYYPYALADSKDEPRISVAGRLMADLIAEAGADRILTMTLHSPQIMGFSRIPVDQLSGVPTICSHYTHLDREQLIVAAPDISRAKVTEAYAKRLGLPLAVVDRRMGGDGSVRVHGVIGDVDGRNVVFFDDEIITGRSIMEGAAAIRDRGGVQIFAGCVHGTLTADTVERLDQSGLEELAITDTIPLPGDKTNPKVKVCSVAALFANAIRAIHEETSISALFN
ncbi:MAG: ribose-phosphate diphosphokinase, partial [Candidatus Latescibacteria bacterium]|nr:ribose-phosphate diphosphokinase [Candidatus Latescibacterota bacterium]